MPIEGNKKGFVFYLEDQAEAKFLMDHTVDRFTEFEHLVYRNIRLQFHYRLGESFREFHYLTRGGARIPYAIETRNYKLGVLNIENDTPSRKESAAAASFLKSYANSRVLYLHQGKDIAVVDQRSITAPVYLFV